MSTNTDMTRIVRIEELDDASSEIYQDPTNILWGIIEIGGKTYKVNLRDLVAGTDGRDPRVTELAEKVDKLTALVSRLVTGMDENEVVEI